jgi:hypothetical protein
MSVEANVEILGQRLVIPTTKSGVIGLLAVIAGFVLIAYFVVNGVVAVVTSGKSENIETLMSVFTSKEIAKTGGQPEVRREIVGNKLVQFWTPSAETQIDLAQNSLNGHVAEEDSWQKTDEKTVDDFENKLWEQLHENTKNSPLHGLRRYQETGRGRTHHKRGWWWTLTMDQNFDTRELAKLYFSFWKNSNDVYVEELNSTSKYE